MPAIRNMMKNGLFILIFSLLFASNGYAAANPSIQAPDEMVKQATTKMLRSINENRAEINKSPGKLKSLVEEIILPHLDFIAASKM
ncbi:MAG: hypothetical protein KAJ39_05725, partial [Gammaproteobacteria bacterium]|nr:hypothetical protein [Gammaproteobacteria bacterium]